jgi:hypothetical protein
MLNVSVRSCNDMRREVFEQTASSLLLEQNQSKSSAEMSAPSAPVASCASDKKSFSDIGCKTLGYCYS